MPGVNVFPSVIASALPSLKLHCDDWMRNAKSYVTCIESGGDCIVNFEEYSSIQATVKHFKCVLYQSQKCDNYQVKRTHWDKIQKRLYHEPDRRLKNANVRMFYRVGEAIFLVKFGFTFGHTIVAEGTAHVYQMSKTSMLLYHLPQSFGNNEFPPCLTEGNFTRLDECYYKVYVLQPLKTYVVPAGTRYLILAVQKTLFSVNVVSEAFPTQNYLLFNENVSPKPESHEIRPGQEVTSSRLPQTLSPPLTPEERYTTPVKKRRKTEKLTTKKNL